MVRFIPIIDFLPLAIVLLFSSSSCCISFFFESFTPLIRTFPLHRDRRKSKKQKQEQQSGPPRPLSTLFKHCARPRSRRRSDGDVLQSSWGGENTVRHSVSQTVNVPDNVKIKLSPIVSISKQTAHHVSQKANKAFTSNARVQHSAEQLLSIESAAVRSCSSHSRFSNILCHHYVEIK